MEKLSLRPVVKCTGVGKLFPYLLMECIGVGKPSLHHACSAQRWGD